MAFMCKLVNVKLQCTHGMFFSLIGMKFHGKFLEANNLYFGKDPKIGGKKLSSGVSLETGAAFWGFLLPMKRNGGMLSLDASLVLL